MFETDPKRSGQYLRWQYLICLCGRLRSAPYGSKNALDGSIQEAFKWKSADSVTPPFPGALQSSKPQPPPEARHRNCSSLRAVQDTHCLGSTTPTICRFSGCLRRRSPGSSHSVVGSHDASPGQTRISSWRPAPNRAPPVSIKECLEATPFAETLGNAMVCYAEGFRSRALNRKVAKG